MDGIGAAAVGGVIALALAIMVLRKFPEVIVRALSKGIDHIYDRKLEEIRGRLRASESAVASSVTYLTQAQSELRLKTLSSVESMWQSIKASHEAYSHAFLSVAILTPEELQEAILGHGGGIGTIQHKLMEYRDLEHVGAKFSVTNEAMSGPEILFVSSRLWEIFTCILRVHGRLGTLLFFSFKNGEYQHWQSDRAMRSILETVLDAEKIESASSRSLGGLNDLLHWLSAAFIEEASTLVRGGRELQHSMPEFYRILKEQHEDGPAGEPPQQR